MIEKPQYYRLFVPNVPDVRVISERFKSEADAQRAKRTILMMYPAATVRIRKDGRIRAGEVIQDYITS